MAAAANPVFPVSVEEYLHSVYEPDMDLVDGVLEDRNLGEFDHALVQRALLLLLSREEQRLGYLAIQELRVQVAPARFRVPDVCLLAADRLPKRIATQPPLLCIEVLSPEDRLPRMRLKVRDYLRMGVPAVWVLDPERKLALIFTSNSETEIREGILQHGDIHVALRDILPTA